MTVGLRIHVEPLPQGVWADENRAEAFEEVYRRCQPELVALCRRLLGGRGDAEAVAQEAFVRAWRSLDSFSGARPFWPWVATIARRLCIDQRRRLGRETTKLHVEATFYETQLTPPPDEILEEDEDYRAARLALQRLKPAEQRVITLREVNGWSYDEIAEFEGVTVESVRGSLKRARVRLRESFAKVAAGAPAALGITSVRRLRLRVSRAIGGAPIANAPAAMAVAGDAALRMAAIVMGVASVATPMHSSLQPAATAPQGLATASGSIASGTISDTTDGDGRPGGGEAVEAPTAPAGAGAPLLPAPPLPSDGATAPEDVAFTTVTPSPGYSSDGTIFASGSATTGCMYVACPVLFRSTDRGRSWHRLRGVGFDGGEVMLPASYPADNRIFAAGPTGLLVSADGGQTFLQLAVITGNAAISPAFSSSDPRILFAATPGWEYRDDVRATKPGGVVLPSTSTSGSVAFAPAYPADSRILVGGTTVHGAARSASAVFLCEDNVCGTSTVLDDFTGAPTVAVSPAYALDNTVVAWRATGLFASTDGGRSFRRLALPGEGTVENVAFTGNGLVAVVRTASADDDRTTLLHTPDLGATWAPFGGGTSPASSIQGLEVLPDGKMLATPTAHAGGGLRCSRDGGRTWARRC